MGSMLTIPRTITVEEIAERLGLSEPVIYRMLEHRQIPALRPSRKWLISRARYEEWESSFGELA